MNLKGKLKEFMICNCVNFISSNYQHSAYNFANKDVIKWKNKNKIIKIKCENICFKQMKL